MKRLLKGLLLGLGTYSFLGGCAEYHWDALAVRVKGPDIDKVIREKISEGQTTREQLKASLGEPIFKFPTASGELLVYRELLQTESGTAYFGGASTVTGHTTDEIILVLEIVADRVVEHRIVHRVYFAPADDIEFGLDDTAFDKYGFPKEVE